jgi:hypothetical protein
MRDSTFIFEARSCYNQTMKARRFMAALIVVLASLGVTIAGVQQKDGQPVELDSSELNRQLQERLQKVEALPRAEQELLRKAYEDATKTEEVQAALAKRDQALREFNEAVRAAILRNDPSLLRVLEKVSR